jgi:hypothetical protein
LGLSRGSDLTSAASIPSCDPRPLYSGYLAVPNRDAACTTSSRPFWTHCHVALVFRCSPHIYSKDIPRCEAANRTYDWSLALLRYGRDGKLASRLPCTRWTEETGMSTKIETTQRPCGLARGPQVSSHAIGRSSRRARKPNLRSTPFGDGFAPIMGAFISLLLGLSVLFVASPASAADCRVSGWTTGYGSHPVFECPGNPQNDTPGGLW